jgi:hypothetical protein
VLDGSGGAVGDAGGGVVPCCWLAARAGADDEVAQHHLREPCAGGGAG